jgi:formylglycine-generating enzyme required for sulfatase activity
MNTRPIRTLAALLCTILALHAADPIAPASTPATPASAPAAPSIPEDKISRLKALVAAGNKSEAAKFADALTLLYPDDHRPAKLLADQPATAALVAPRPEESVPSTPPAPAEEPAQEPVAPAATLSASAPSGATEPTGLDRVKWAGIEELMKDASTTQDVAERTRILTSVLEKTALLRGTYPRMMRLWFFRAFAAQQVRDFTAGSEAGRKLIALGATESGDAALLTLLGRMENEGYLTVAPELDPSRPGNLPRELTVTLAGNVPLEMVWIEPGSFTMGALGGSGDEQPAHPVTITRGFWLGKYEVTQAQWQAIMRTNPALYLGPNRPVENVSWDDIQTFLQRANANAIGMPPGYTYALPTEAQWEYACRAGTTGDYAGPLDELAWFSGNSQNRTHSVGLKRPNAWGLYDMHGNVREWCADWFGDYSGAAAVDPRGATSGVYRVNRGGGCNNGAVFCRSANRYLNDPSNRRVDLGFRLALRSTR